MIATPSSLSNLQTALTKNMKNSRCNFSFHDFDHFGYAQDILQLNDEYTMVPSKRQLVQNKLIAENGLKISRASTSIQWKGRVDLSKLKSALKNLIKFTDSSVEVYPIELEKPPQGQELNRTCIATFKPSSYIIDRETIQKNCRENGSDLVSINLLQNTFSVKIQHFSFYGYGPRLSQNNQKKFKSPQQPSSPQPSQNIKKKPVPTKKHKMYKFLDQSDEQSNKQYNTNQTKQYQDETNENYQQKQDLIQIILKRQKHEKMLEQQNRRSLKALNLEEKGPTKKIKPNSSNSFIKYIAKGQLQQQQQNKQNQSHQNSQNYQQQLTAKDKRLNHQSIKFVGQLLAKNITSNKPSHQLFDASIFNKWILDQSVPWNLKSPLILYIILNRFESIQFCFVRTVKVQEGVHKKQVTIKPRKLLNFNLENSKSVTAQTFKDWADNLLFDYLKDYIQWLIWVNQGNLKLQFYNKDSFFEALALNNNEKQVARLQNFKQQHTKQSAFINEKILYLLNGQDIFFTSTTNPSKNNMFLKFKGAYSVNDCIPFCHWLLRLNVSLKYLLEKKVQWRIQQCIVLQNICKEEIEQFPCELWLFSNTFLKENLNNETVSFVGTGNTVGNDILCWLFCQLSQSRQNKKKSKVNYIPTKQVCRNLLLSNNTSQSSQLKNNLKLSLQILSLDFSLNNQQKKNILCSQLFSCRLKPNGQSIDSVAKRCPQFQGQLDEFSKDPQVSNLEVFEDLVSEYDLNQKHRIKAFKDFQKQNLCSGLQNLLKIDLSYQDDVVQERIRKLIGFQYFYNELNVNTLRKFRLILMNFVDKIEDYQRQQAKKSSFQNIRKQNSSMFTLEEKKHQTNQLICYLNIILDLGSLNMENFQTVNELITINSQNKKQSWILFSSQSMSAIINNFLRVIFSNSQFISEIKLNYVNFKRQSLLSQNVILVLYSQQAKNIPDKEEQTKIKNSLDDLPFTSFMTKLQKLVELDNENYEQQLQMLRFELRLMDK